MFKYCLANIWMTVLSSSKKRLAIDFMFMIGDVTCYQDWIVTLLFSLLADLGTSQYICCVKFNRGHTFHSRQIYTHKEYVGNNGSWEISCESLMA